MPEKYSERPPSVDAIQFDGDPESAFEINAWLSNYGFVVMYDQPRSRMIIQTSAGAYLPTTEATDWVTLSPELVAKIMKNSDFELKYEPTNVSPEQLPAPPEDPPA